MRGTTCMHRPHFQMANTEEDLHVRGLSPAHPAGPPYPPPIASGYPPHFLDEGVLHKINSHYKFPSWDGRPESWRAFSREWEAACLVHAATITHPTMKTITFMESLPVKYQQIFKAWWTDYHWGFPEMWGYIADFVSRNLSAAKEVQVWENLKPKGKSFEEYVDWYREFVRMGNDLPEGAINEFQWMTAYRRGLMY